MMIRSMFILILLFTLFIVNSAFSSNKVDKGVTINLGVGGVVSMPRGGWKGDLNWYLDGWHPGAAVSGNLTVRLTDRNLKRVIGIVPVPIVSIIGQYEFCFNGHFSDIEYTGGYYETELKHRYMTATGGVQVYPLRFLRFYAPFVEYQVGWIKSIYSSSAGDSNNGEYHDELGGVYREYDNANGVIHKISIGHDFQIKDNFGIILKTRWQTTNSTVVEPLVEHHNVSDYYEGKIKSTDICLDFYVSF